MKYTLTTLMLTCLLIACKDEPFVRPTCTEIDAIMESDQLYRSDYRTSAFFTVADSLARAKYGDKMIPDDVGEFMGQANEITKGRPESDFIDIDFADSLWVLQDLIDNKNVERLLEIFERSTVEELDKLDCLKKQSILPFVHSDEKYADKVRKCIDKHKDFMGYNRYRHIRWHIDGRGESISESISKADFEKI